MIEAIWAYFQLSQYMPSAFNNFKDVVRAFKSKQVAAVIDGPWLWTQLLRDEAHPIDTAVIGVSLPPGPPFVGGSNLIVSRHIEAKTVDPAMRLIAQLTSLEVQRTLCEQSGLLPVRKELFEEPPYTTDEIHSTFKRALHEGRPLPRIVLWGPLEVSLVQAFGQVWDSIKIRGFRQIEDAIRKHLEPVAERFDRTFEIS